MLGPWYALYANCCGLSSALRAFRTQSKSALWTLREAAVSLNLRFCSCIKVWHHDFRISQRPSRGRSIAPH